MSKYTEVLTHLKENICKNCCTWDKSLRNCDTCNVSVELESLEIADRLEQAGVVERLKNDAILVLEDIRGDNNGD